MRPSPLLIAMALLAIPALTACQKAAPQPTGVAVAQPAGGATDPQTPSAADPGFNPHDYATHNHREVRPGHGTTAQQGAANVSTAQKAATLHN